MHVVCQLDPAAGHLQGRSLLVQHLTLTQAFYDKLTSLNLHHSEFLIQPEFFLHLQSVTETAIYSWLKSRGMLNFARH